jgi:putative addiction module component (TIGR02574 family)
MAKKVWAEIMELPVAERIQLVEDIWDSIVEAPEAMPLTPAQTEELERRLEAYHRDPTAGRPWEEIKDRVRRS